ncbi:plexin-C1 [Stegastes partitus]|uniref:Plexin-C1 n=1 Tax=Stegastes partitus TaxID=144197 RepID=A0A9Y4NF71_9TELE|nr:PREDICTED: plexin-C1 [Stegastes partitus]
MILLLALLSVLWGQQARCLLFDGDIRHLAVATSGVYVATDTKLYQLSHDLTLVRSLSQRGILTAADQPENEQFHRVSETDVWNATFSVNMLLPFVANKSVFSCGVTDNQCGYCEVLDLHDISKLLYREHIQVGPLRRSSGSVGFLLDVKMIPTGIETYILTAVQQRKDETSRCRSDSGAINLHNAKQGQSGGIFSLNDGLGKYVIESQGGVEFVDGFQISSVIYLLSNVLPQGESNRVRLLWLEGETKTKIMRSMRGATLSASDGEGSRLLASSVIPGEQPVLWSGVFSVDGGESNTELLVFDISPDVRGQTDSNPDFYPPAPKPGEKPKTLKPKAVLFRQNNMTSVLAVRHKAWVVFFIGTADGQLIKLAVDRNYRSACPTVLYRVDDDRKVFPRIHLDQVDQKHVYVPFRNQKQTPEETCPCLLVVLKMRLGKTHLLEQLEVTNCSGISGPPSSVLCQQCIKAGCGWSKSGCSWANEGEGNDSVCQKMDFGKNFSRPEISSITPSVVSFHGRNHATLSGRNLREVSRVRIQGDLDCTPQESPVWNNTGTSLTFHIPSTDIKGVVKVCVLLPDGSCHGNTKITYRSAPSCTDIKPRSTWISGKRKITLMGSHLEFVEGIIHSHAPQEVRLPTDSSNETIIYDSLAAENSPGISSSTVSMKVANETLACSTTLTYYPDPEFTSFTSIKIGDDVRITIEKKADKLEMTEAELSVSGVQGENEYTCSLESKDTDNVTDFFTCEIKSSLYDKFEHLSIKYGDKEVIRKPKSSALIFLMLIVLLLIPCIIVVVVIVYRSQQRKLNAKVNKFMHDLELDVRNDIRQGFVDLQTEKADLMENVGAIPFLDYKHFAARIFFPESDSLRNSCIRDIGQDVVKVQLDECCHSLSRLLKDQLFLVSMVHALEEKKSFTIKDKCSLASLLTVALHGNLSYLTEVMEVLLKDLMQRNSNAQPKLLLRRTESTVEKLLTNWMSICLYGFLRETVGQHLFLMVSALTQQIAKGPVDCVTEKALYTLSEDWLLWQAQDFSSLKLKALFAVDSDGGVSEPLEVSALSCDTVEQVKEKILSTFKAKFGFPFSTTLGDVSIEYEKDGSFIHMEEVDASSEVIGEVTMLNTLKHYKVDDGATIKMLSRKNQPPLSPQGSLKDDENFSGKYFHLIDPDVEEDQRKNPERKKLKLKEVHLTKLLSTKVAVHSFVENLFRSIWGMLQNKAPHAVKYFFDFLDTQADNMKITDPDVLHIWKTNSLPLRFWVNILKNPQFVFDMEKTPHLDGCLSVIAQAFMDCFSLSEIQLGKHAPTNKLLYAKDIPQFKLEVKTYYRQIREQSPMTDTEFKDFLQQESKKHENEFNEAAALKELYKFIQQYFTEIKEKLDQNGAPAELTEQLQHVKDSFDGLKSCSWD